MRVGLTDIDAEIATKIEERLLAPLKEFLRENIHWKGLPFALRWQWNKGGPTLERKREPTQDEKNAYDLRVKREERYNGWVAATSCVPLIAGGICASLLSGLGASPPAIWVSFLTVTATGVSAGVWKAKRETPKARLCYALNLDEMRSVFPLLALNRAERIYCDALLMLSRMQLDAQAEASFRETLRQLNDLLANYRHIEARKQSLIPILGMNSVSDLEREYGELGRRIDAVSDSVARRAIEQSLEMCASRLESARQLKQNLERLNTQQEAIVQTLASATSAMARLHLAPTVRQDETAQEIAQNVESMNRETWAVEQAVEEVASLRNEL